jgi:hypothetical protein
MRFTTNFIGAFTSAEHYRQVRQRATFEMRYSFLLILASSLLLVLHFTHLLHGELFTARAGKPAVFDDVVRQIAQQIPLMTLQNNQLITREAKPHSIRIQTEFFGRPIHGNIATIDTTGATTHHNMQTWLLITSHEFIIRNTDKTEIHSLSDYNKSGRGTLVINRAVANDTAANLVRTVHRYLIQGYLILGGIALLITTVVLYVLRLAMLAALGVAGVVVGRLMHSPLRYRAAFSLAAISYTPVAMTNLLLMLGFGRWANSGILLLGGIAMLAVAIAVTRDTPSSE